MNSLLKEHKIRSQWLVVLVFFGAFSFLGIFLHLNYFDFQQVWNFDGWPAPIVRQRPFAEYFKCLHHFTSRLATHSIWKQVRYFQPTCVALTGKYNQLNISGFKNRDEHKDALIPKNMKNGSECNIITLGIGYDIEAELKMAEVLPLKCRFFGADPVARRNKENFERIGQYFEMAVAAKSGFRTASVLGWRKEEIYRDVPLFHVGLVEFLRHHVKVKKYVDNMLIDNEYAEFDMVPMFHRGGDLDKTGIVLCQFNVEFHPPRKPEQKTKFGSFYQRNVEERRYAPFNVHGNPNLRLYFVNVEDEECIRRYVSHMFEET